MNACNKFSRISNQNFIEKIMFCWAVQDINVHENEVIQKVVKLFIYE